MKLAQALNIRKKMSSDFHMTATVVQSISVQAAGDPKPEKEPNELIASMLSQIEEEWKLIDKIDAANFSTKLKNGMTLMQALTKRDVLAKRKETMVKLCSLPSRGGYGREEKTVVVLDVSKLRNIVNDLSRQWRELDDMIQETNWQVEI